MTEEVARRRAPIHYGWVVLAVSTLSVFALLGLGRFGYTMVLPAMQKDLGLSNALAGSLATANLAGYAAMSVLGGALAARYGTRSVVPLGLAIAGVGMGLTGLAQGFAGAALWRVVTGVGTGFANVPLAALPGAWFARRLRGLGSGIVVSGSSIGLILVGPLVPRLLANSGPGGWRMVWWIYGVVTLAIAVLAHVFLRNRPADKGLSPVGMTEKPAPASVAMGSVSPTADATIEPAAAPLAPVAISAAWKTIVRKPIVWHLGLVYFTFGLAYLAFMTFFTKHLITSGGYTEQAAGDLYMLLGWCTVVSGVVWGVVSDHIGRKWALALVYLIQATSFALFALWQTPAGFTTAAVVFGLSAWSVPAIMAATCTDIFGARLAPAAFGCLTLFFAVGQAAGPAVAGAIADATGSFVAAFLLASGVAVLGALGAAFLGSTHRSG